ncbi:unnamed protein product, partial [Pylaiella littoralis]
DEAPDEVDATDKDAQRWNNRGLQDAMSRSARLVMRYMPRIAAGGALIPPGMRAGDAGVKSPRAVAAQFRARFPNAPICRPLESVEDRALAAMQLKAATPAMKKRAEEGEDMGYLLREAAMGVFATVHVDVAIFAHELVFFPIMVKDERFQARTENGTAVVMICPGCKSNKFVKPPGVSGHGFPCLSAKLRVAHDIAGVAVPVAGRYACLGPTCPLRMESAKRAAEKAKVVIGDDGWDEDTIRKYSPNGASFTTMDDRVQQEMERKAGREPTLWPGWKFKRGTIAATPSVTVLNTIYSAGHEEDKGHMHAGVVAQAGGQIINCDGTFRIAGRVLDDANCLYFVLGERGKVHAYAAVKSESKGELLPLFTRYAERRERSGTSGTLQWVYDDNCCQGAKDTGKHYTVDLFDGVTRRPLG